MYVSMKFDCCQEEIHDAADFQGNVDNMNGYINTCMMIKTSRGSLSSQIVRGIKP